MIQVCTRLWPEPGPRTQTVPFPASPTGTMEMPVLEPERRKNHIDKIDCSHALLPIAMDCLHYQENERPSSEELCQRLAGLKESREYRESVQQVERVQNDIAELERQMGEMQVREAANSQQLHNENNMAKRLKMSNFNKRRFSQKQQEKQLTKRKALNQQLEEQEQVTAEIQQTNHSLQRQVEQLQQQLSQQTQQNTKPPSPVPLQAQVRGRQLHRITQ